ncbi:phage tail tube protein [Rhodococcus triatomae]|nr:Phage associated structural protein [Rhodococcus triatomae BKS 15-14]
MAYDNENILTSEAGASGVVFRAPLGTAAPGPAGSILPVAWLDHGLVSEDGITETPSEDTKDVKSLGGKIVKVLKTSYGLVFKFQLQESKNAVVLRSLFGEGNVTVSGSTITVNKGKTTLPYSAWVIDTIDGDNNVRNYIPKGQPRLVGDIKYVHTETIAYEVEITSFEEAGLNAVMTMTDADGTVTKTITLPTATAGTFTIYVDGETTAGIAYNATAAAVKTALEALITVGSGNATVTGSTGGPYTAVFANGAGLVTASGSGLTPAGTVTVA